MSSAARLLTAALALAVASCDASSGDERRMVPDASEPAEAGAVVHADASSDNEDAPLSPTECERLQRQARYEAGTAKNALEIAQCRADEDCGSEWVVYRVDACWDDCAGMTGDRDYLAAFKDIVHDACKPFFAKGCTVIVASCVAPGPQPPMWTCVDAHCVVN